MTENSDTDKNKTRYTSAVSLLEVIYVSTATEINTECCHMTSKGVILFLYCLVWKDGRDGGRKQTDRPK